MSSPTLPNGTMSKWDERFFELAKLVSSWSKDPSTKVGAVLVDTDNRILSVGYNGFSRHNADTEKQLNNRPDKYLRTIHAEMNAILNYRGPLKDLSEATLYTYPLAPCPDCVKHILQANICVVKSKIEAESQLVDLELIKDLFIEGYANFEIY